MLFYITTIDSEIFGGDKKNLTRPSENPSWKTFCSFSQPFGFINGCLGVSNESLQQLLLFDTPNNHL